jgi:hypothetical protein
MLDINKCLLECLTSAKEYGINFSIYNWLEVTKIDCDATVFLDMCPTFGSAEQPFVCVKNDMSCEEIECIMDQLAGYICGDLPFLDLIDRYIFKPEEETKKCSFFGEDIYAPKIISLAEIGFDLENEQVSVPWDFVIAEIEGTEIKLSKDDIIGLSKVYNLMKEFGYKIKEVVMCTPS